MKDFRGCLPKFVTQTRLRASFGQGTVVFVTCYESQWLGNWSLKGFFLQNSQGHTINFSLP